MQRDNPPIRRSLPSNLLPLTFAALLWAPWGCASHPASPAVRPSATVTPQITAADIHEIKQDIRQVQTTVATTSYALDGERAKLARQRTEIEERVRVLEDLKGGGGGDSGGDARADARADARPKRGRWLTRLGLKDSSDE